MSTEGGPGPDGGDADGPDVADGDPIDVGHGVYVQFTSWGPHAPAGLIETHRSRLDGSACSGSVLFDLVGVRDAFPDMPLWQVESMDPLTISPSLLCMTCGHHGWLRRGRWEPA